VEETLRSRGEVTVEHVHLKKLDLQPCRGCLQCMRRGEERCPCRDDLLSLRDQMRAADGVIFACPVYVHTVPGPMKTFYDRLAFQCHQPAYQQQAALCVTTTELTGARETLDYMQFVAFTWGFQLAGTLDVVYPGYEKEDDYRNEAERRVEQAATNLWAAMTTPRPAPSVKELVFFHLMRTKVTLHRHVLNRDFEYWEERGWLDQSWYDANAPVSAWKSRLARGLARLRVRKLLRHAGLSGEPSHAAPAPAKPS
jgi:multimeric flavodoxin WrbA